MKHCVVEIAGLRLGFWTADPEMDFSFSGSSALFLADEEAATDATIQFSWGDLSEDVAGTLLFDSDGTWKLYKTSEGYAFRLAVPFFGATPYRIGYFDENFNFGHVICHYPYRKFWQGISPLSYPLDEWLCVQLLAQGRGVEFHATGIVDEKGDGYLFLGQSGAGKTTTSLLWLENPNITILSDDRIVVRRDKDNQYWIYGTPWHGLGELSSSARAPLRQVFFLEKGPEAKFYDISIAETIARFFACGFPTFHNIPGMEFTLGFYEELAHHIPHAVLSFRPDQTAVEAVRRYATR